MTPERRRCPFPILPLGAWPEQDRQAWLAALAPVSLFDDRPSLAQFPQDRIRHIADAFGRWLGYLGTVPPALNLTGFDTLDRDHISRFIAALRQHLAPCTVRGYVSDLWMAIHHMAPDQEHADLRRAMNACRKRARPQSDKVLRVVSASRLYELGFKLMEDAVQLTNGNGATPLQALQLYRDGLTIALLIARPIRIGNFARLELDRHLIRRDQGYRLVLDSSEVKTGRAYELDLPQGLTAAIDYYCDVVRPQLLTRSGRWTRPHSGAAFWINRDGGPFRPRALSARLVKLTTRHVGHPVNPHLFRDCAATSIATNLPEHVAIIAPILGHSNVQTGERYYNQARSLTAARRYQDILTSLREDGS